MYNNNRLYPEDAAAIRRYALWLAEQYGLCVREVSEIPYDRTNSAPDCEQSAYMGDSLQLITPDLDAGLLLHEVHHYIYASPEQRATRYYGDISQDDEVECCVCDVITLRQFNRRIADAWVWDVNLEGVPLTPTKLTRQKIVALVRRWRLTNQTESATTGHTDQEGVRC